MIYIIYIISVRYMIINSTEQKGMLGMSTKQKGDHDE